MVNESEFRKDFRKLSLTVVMCVITAISAQLSFKIGFVPYTMQNFAVMLAGFLLGPYYGFISQALYLTLIAVGLPLASSGGGLGVLLGPTAGFLFGFPIAAFLAGVFRRKIRSSLILWLSTFLAALPIYILGFLVFYNIAIGNAKLSAWAESIASPFGISGSLPLVIFFATVLIFIPQDMFVDHLLAVVVYRYVERLIRERGFEID
uniref:Biotin transporter BioY n=1 Tax=Geoglobus ahangari TaxID=113653 RepID=A0A7C3YG85_9EURY